MTPSQETIDELADRVIDAASRIPELQRVKDEAIRKISDPNVVQILVLTVTAPGRMDWGGYFDPINIAVAATKLLKMAGEKL